MPAGNGLDSEGIWMLSVVLRVSQLWNSSLLYALTWVMAKPGGGEILQIEPSERSHFHCASLGLDARVSKQYLCFPGIASQFLCGHWGLLSESLHTVLGMET